VVKYEPFTDRLAMLWVLLSNLAGAETMCMNAVGSFLIEQAWVGSIAANLGGVLTFGLVLFASMDSCDHKHRLALLRSLQAKKYRELPL